MELRLMVPATLTAAPYADMAMVSHNEHGFTLEFAALNISDQPTELTEAMVVARVKVPPSVIFQIASAIAENVDHYEQRFGKITPRQPEGS